MRSWNGKTTSKKIVDLTADATPLTILAEDEAKLYLQATTMAVWAPAGQPVTVRVDPGRSSTAFFGTLNLHTGQAHITQADTMTAVTTAVHLESILAAYPTDTILLLWDKAPWHRGDAIREVLAAHPRLTLWAFPTAAPDLNPQEHVWRATRRAVAHNHTQRQLPELARRFAEFLTTTTFPSTFLAKYSYPVCPGFT